MNLVEISVRIDKMTKRWPGPMPQDSLRQAELVFRDAELGMPRVNSIGFVDPSVKNHNKLQ